MEIALGWAMEVIHREPDLVTTIFTSAYLQTTESGTRCPLLLYCDGSQVSYPTVSNWNRHRHHSGLHTIETFIYRDVQCESLGYFSWRRPGGAPSSQASGRKLFVTSRSPRVPLTRSIR